MKKCYQVAGHRFGVELPDSHPVWEAMHCNYDPFLIDEDNTDLFVLRNVAFMPDTSAKCLVNEAVQGEGYSSVGFYELNGRWLMELTAPFGDTPTVFVLCTKDFSDACFYYKGDAGYALNTVLMLLFAFATARKDTLLMHASVTMCQGKGYLFLGKSGTGKSTHSQLWINNIEGCELLNDDNPVLRVEANGVVRVYGSPWSGKTLCYRNLDVPVGAIVDLHQAKYNAITRQKLAYAYASIYSSFSGLRFIKEMADGCHNAILKIITTVPCYSLECLPDTDAAVLCYNTIAK